MLGFLSGLGLTTKVTLGFLLVIAAMSAGFGLYYKYAESRYSRAQTRIEVLNQEITAQRVRAETAEINLAQLRENITKQAAQLEELNRKLAASRKKSQELAKLLSEHDLQYLALEKPGLIERRVNSASDVVFEELKELSNPESYKTQKDEE